jgi:hypothetical protein
MTATTGTTRRRPQGRGRHLQRGIALLALLAFAGLLFGIFLFGLFGTMKRQNEADRRTSDTLAQAKSALLGYAASYRDRNPGDVFGYLPCPDMIGGGIAPEGNEEGTCGTRDVTVIGRFPWKTLGLTPLRDQAAECLWYAVSGNFKANPKTNLLNWDSTALMEVIASDGASFLAGSDPTNRAAAVIFSPGAIVQGQDRFIDVNTQTCGGNYVAANYLDTDVASAINNATPSANVNGLTRFIAALNSDNTPAANDRFNDKLAIITPQEIFTEVTKRSDFLPRLVDTDPAIGVLGALAACVSEYGKRNNPLAKKALPWAARPNLAEYHLATSYADADKQFSGRAPFSVANSVADTANTLPVASVLLNQCPGWASVDEHWNNWKDHFFYAVAKAYSPESPDADKPDPCGVAGQECLTVDGVGRFAAVLVFSGERRTNPVQNRNTVADATYASPDKGNPANYLEGVNLAAIQNNTPTAAAPRNFSKSAGNDVLICIQADAALTVDPTCAVILGTPPTNCDTDGDLLVSYRDAVDSKKNNCNNPDGKGAVQACRDIKDRVKANCKKKCADAAQNFIDKPCIDNLNDKGCKPVMDDLADSTVCAPK